MKNKGNRVCWDAGGRYCKYVSILQHAKEQDRHQYPNPLVRDVLPELPNEYRHTASGGQFLIFDIGVRDRNRMIIFGYVVNHPRNSKRWFTDGTFQMCLEIFLQSFTIMH